MSGECSAPSHTTWMSLQRCICRPLSLENGSSEVFGSNNLVLLHETKVWWRGFRKNFCLVHVELVQGRKEFMLLVRYDQLGTREDLYGNFNPSRASFLSIIYCGMYLTSFKWRIYFFSNLAALPPPPMKSYSWCFPFLLTETVKSVIYWISVPWPPPYFPPSAIYLPYLNFCRPFMPN